MNLWSVLLWFQVTASALTTRCGKPDVLKSDVRAKYSKETSLSCNPFSFEKNKQVATIEMFKLLQSNLLDGNYTKSNIEFFRHVKTPYIKNHTNNIVEQLGHADRIIAQRTARNPTKTDIFLRTLSVSKELEQTEERQNWWIGYSGWNRV